ncbi:MAG: DUF72 domain-containing protein [Planctomycetota bacterium]
MSDAKPSPGQDGLFGPLAESQRPKRGQRKGGGRIGPAPVEEAVRRAAQALPAPLFLGTSSWSFPGWAGLVYDRGATESELARDGLQAYAQHPLFRAAGIDRTYYVPIGARVFAGYAAAVPDTFRFLVKAHEDCVIARYPHSRRYGARAGAENPRFLDPTYALEAVVTPLVEGLGEKAGPLLFQFPPQDLKRLGGVAAFIERLHTFLRALPRNVLYAIELRNEEVLVREYREALRDVGACHCLNVHPTMPGIEAQARLMDVLQGPAVVIRWMLGSGLSYEEAVDEYAPFDKIVREDARSRAEIAALCLQAAPLGRFTYVIVNNKAEGSAPLTLVRLAQEIEERQSR